MNDPRPASDVTPIEPLPGEAGIPNVATTARPPWSKKGLAAVVLLIGSLIAVSALSIQRFLGGGKKPDDETKLTAQRPAAAGADPRKLDMQAAATRVPAIEPTAEERAEPIGVRRTAQAQPANSGARPISPEDAPVLLVTSRPSAAAKEPPRSASRDAAQKPAPDDSTSAAGDPLDQTRHNLEGYQRQLHGLLDTLTKSATTAASPGVPGAPPSATLPGVLTPGATSARVAASTLGNRSLTLPKGTAFTCALKTKVITATSGVVACQVLRNVFSDDGRVLLIERGSHLDGEYRIASVRPGTVRIPVMWTRLRTPHGVTVDFESPGTGQLGESGIDGHVDNRWGERIGAAMLLSLIDDSVKLVIQNQANDPGSGNSGDTIVLPSTTANTSKLAEKVLDSTINIPPLIYQNQGGIVGIVVARDVDFSPVYELQLSTREAPR
jgi:type IV secretion system protein VirB10